MFATSVAVSNCKVLHYWFELVRDSIVQDPLDQYQTLKRLGILFLIQSPNFNSKELELNSSKLFMEGIFFKGSLKSTFGKKEPKL